jgi:hypothetical protein
MYGLKPNAITFISASIAQQIVNTMSLQRQRDKQQRRMFVAGVLCEHVVCTMEYTHSMHLNRPINYNTLKRLSRM